MRGSGAGKHISTAVVGLVISTLSYTSEASYRKPDSKPEGIAPLLSFSGTNLAVVSKSIWPVLRYDAQGGGFSATASYGDNAVVWFARTPPLRRDSYGHIASFSSATRLSGPPASNMRLPSRDADESR